MRRLALVAVLTLACGALPAHAQTLSLAYKAGDVYKYGFHATSTGEVNVLGTNAPVNNELTALETVTVKSVDPSGVADVSLALSNITIKSEFSGTSSTTTGIPLPAVEVKIASDGRILTANGTSMEAGLAFSTGLGGNLVSAVLPDTPVKPGDTWSKDYDQTSLPSPATGAIHVTTKSKYLRDESFQGINAAVIETTSDAAIDVTLDMSLPPPGSGPSPFPAPTNGGTGIAIKGTTTSDVTTWIDPSNRRILKSHMTAKTNGTMTFVMAPGSTTPAPLGPMSVSGNETLDLKPA
jgi:hypothetical protein